MNMRLREIADAINASSTGTDDQALVSRICIDSRAVAPGDLFFCIVGQNLDGHEFAAQAVAQGAVAVVAGKPLELPVPVLLVRDTVQALGKLARTWREQAKGIVIGVTGSAGKTTVKEMLAQVLSVAGSTGKNFRNLNNQIGLPLSILELRGDEKFWVLELGISQPGDMDELGHILAPDVAVLLNAGPCHLEGLGSLAGVAAQKAVLLDYVRSDGFACVNADSALLLAEAGKRTLPAITFSGTGQAAAYSCLQRDDAPNAQTEGFIFNMRTPQGELRLATSAHAHVAENVAAVTAVALELGLTPEHIAKGLGQYESVTQRFVRSRVGSWVFIDDTYNANPMSMARSIQEAETLAQDKRLVLVLADMLDLGTDSARAHQELGRCIAGTSATHCFFSGEHASDVQAGLDGFQGLFAQVHSAEEVGRALEKFRHDAGVMLFKGSRGRKMEHYFSFLERNWA